MNAMILSMPESTGSVGGLRHVGPTGLLEIVRKTEFVTLVPVMFDVEPLPLLLEFHHRILLMLNCVWY